VTPPSVALPVAERAVRAAPRLRLRLRTALAVSPALVALTFWLISFRRIDLGRMADFGLLSVLPWTFYAALAVLIVGFALALGSSPLPERVLALHTVVLILIVHGTPVISYGTLRYAWAWKHVGIVDYIQRHGSVDPAIGFLTAYHNWPGFFALSALYTQLAGFTSALSFAAWAPVFFNLLSLGALVVLFGTLTNDRRRVWLAAWWFVAANWVGQDYFSPQAFAYFLFLVVVAICVAWFRVPASTFEVRGWRPLPAGRSARWFAELMGRSDADASWHEDAGRSERIALVLLVVLVTATIASSHQLTPLMLVLALSALVLFRRLSLRSLPVLVAVISVGWVGLFSVGFLRGNLYWIAASFGTVTENASSTLINLASASPDQQVVARVDRMLTLGVWVLGGLGMLRIARRGHPDLSATVLALAAFGALGMTSYGSEILFRVYLFSLPFFVLLATGIVFPDAWSGRRWPAAAAQVLMSALLIAGFLVAYYGKERQNYFSKDEVGAAEYLYRTAPPGSLLVAGVNNYPWAFTHYEDYTYVALSELAPHDRKNAIAKPAESVSAIASRDAVPCAYVILTSSQEAAVDMTGLMPKGSLDAISRGLSASSRFRLMLRNPSAVVFGTAVGKSAIQCQLP
jgi:hypothetical protein